MTLGAYLALVGINALTLAIPQFIRWIVDRGIGGKDTNLLLESVIALLILTLVKGVLTFWQGRWTEQASQNVAYDLRNALHRKFAELSFSYHDRTRTGQLLSRTMQDVERVRFVTGRAFLRLVDSTVLMLGSAAILVWMNPRLALLALVMLPFLGHRALYLGRRLRPISLAVQQQLAVLTTRLEQNLRGARVVKVFAQEDAEIARFDQENDRWFNLSVRSSRLRSDQHAADGFDREHQHGDYYLVRWAAGGARAAHARRAGGVHDLFGAAGIAGAPAGTDRAGARGRLRGRSARV